MAGTAEQQAIIALQGELGAVRAQVVAVTTAYDALKGAHEALNAASDRLLGERAAEIKATEDRLRNLIFRQKFDLLDSKDLKPDPFKGGRTGCFKPWSKKLKAFCNSKSHGFRAMLEWAEGGRTEIIDARAVAQGGAQAQFAEAVSADAKLHDFLI